MGLTLDNFMVAFSIFIILFISFYFQRTRNFNYWRDRNVPYIKPVFPIGSVKDLALATVYIGKAYDKMYNQFPFERYFGIIDLQDPVLVLRDPELIRAVLVKDFHHFKSRTNIQNKQKEYILRHVINLSGQEWKEMRALLSPAFTIGKMKLLYVLMEKCCNQLKEYLNRATEINMVVDITELLAHFTMDIIATSAFGLETDSINNPNCKFFLTVGKMLRTSKCRFFKRILNNFFPTLIKFLPLPLIPPDVTHLLTKAVRDTVEYREKNNIRRNDFLDLLIQTRQQRKNIVEENEICRNNTDTSQPNVTGLSIEDMTAQAFMFFIAGYTTDVSVMSFCLYELSRNQDIQAKLLQDIEHALYNHGGSMNYETLHHMTYLDRVINETLRLYGSGQTLTRVCTEPYNIQGTDFVLEKGIKILIPTYSLHHDPTYFPDPYQFNPDRFSHDQVKVRHPSVFLPFGDGPRNCIGRNFGILQMKIGLATIINNFQVSLSAEQEVPIEIDKRCIVVTPAKPILLKFKKRNK